MRLKLAAALCTVLVSLPAVSARSSQAKSGSVRLAEGNVVPRIERQMLPTLPPYNTVSGNVDIQVVVLSTGAIGHTRVAKSADPAGALDRACLEALQSWKFLPARDYGTPVSTLVVIRFSVTAGGQAGTSNATASMGTVQLTPGPQEYVPATGEGPVVPAPGARAGVEWPRVVREIRPSYTSEAMRAKVQGQVEMEVIVAPDGTVGAARVTKSLDKEHGLDQAALTAARYWHFIPGTKNGVAVPMQVGLVLEFRLH